MLYHMKKQEERSQHRLPSLPEESRAVPDDRAGSFEDVKDTLLILTPEVPFGIPSKHGPDDPRRSETKSRMDEKSPSTTHLVPSKHRAFRGFAHMGSSRNSTRTHA